MGGRLWIESPNPKARGGGQGSVFHFTARLQRSETEPGDAPLPKLLPESLAGIPGLIVDDSETNREILQAMLESWNMKPILADSALEAMTALERALRDNTRFPFILLDCDMPDADGFAVGERIRRDPRFNNTDIIMLTSATRLGDAKRARDMGFAAYLIKPVKQSELLDAILLTLGTQVLKAVRAECDTAPAESRDHPAASDSKPPGLHILVAEDNATNRIVASRMLERDGHTVSIAENGQQAVEYLKREQVHLVFMDVQMPVMDGFAALQIIRDPASNVLDHAVPVVAMTAHAMKGDRERCLREGMDGYVSKPLSRERLREAIAEVQGRQSAPDESPAPEANEAERDPTAAVSELPASEVANQEFMQNAVRVFLAEYPLLLRRIETAVQARDRTMTAQAARSFKHAAAAFDHQPCGQAAAILEEAAWSRDADDLDHAWAALRQAAEELRSDLA